MQAPMQHSSVKQILNKLQFDPLRMRQISVPERFGQPQWKVWLHNAGPMTHCSVKQRLVKLQFGPLRMRQFSVPEVLGKQNKKIGFAM